MDSNSKPYLHKHKNSIVIGNSQISAVVAVNQDPGLIQVNNLLKKEDLTICEKSIIKIKYASDSPRIDIDKWYFRTGSTNPISPESEKGYTNGWHKLKEFSLVEATFIKGWHKEKKFDPTGWAQVNNLTLVPFGFPSYIPNSYPGYAWYCQKIALPSTWRGNNICFCLGGCDENDWKDYRVYINGFLIGSSSRNTRIHEPICYTIRPDDSNYEILEFGEENILSIQVCGMDRTRSNMLKINLETYNVKGVLAEQCITSGEPYSEISDFYLDYVNSNVNDQEAKVSLFLKTKQDNRLSFKVNYWVNSDTPVICKNVEIQNNSDCPKTLLEVDLASNDFEGSFVSEGGFGEICVIDGGWFTGVAHPAGLTLGQNNKVILRTLPGKAVEKKDTFISKTAVIGAGSSNNGRQNFVKYIESQCCRKSKFLRIFDPYGLYMISSAIYDKIELTEESLLDNLKQLQEHSNEGIKYDYYSIDCGWNDPSTLKKFNSVNFPNGIEKGLKKIKELGMELLLWVSPGDGPAAFHSEINYRNEGMDESLCKDAIWPWRLCPAGKVWKKSLDESLVHLVKFYNIKGFKIDGFHTYCYNKDHEHFPGRYSTEPIMDAIIEILQKLREIEPDIFLMLYWGFISPWWLLYADTIYERHYLMEAAAPSNSPSDSTRHSVINAQDQGHQFNWERLPLMCQDSNGVWLTETSWGSWQGKENWQDAFVMDFARGGMLSQLWGNLGLLDDADVTFLQKMHNWLGKYGDYLKEPLQILGFPWGQNAYGYLYSINNILLVFLYNFSFTDAKVDIPLNKYIDFALAKDGVQAACLHPINRRGLLDNGRVYSSNETIEIVLRPFEVLMLHICPEISTEIVNGFSPTVKHLSRKVNLRLEYVKQISKITSDKDKNRILNAKNKRIMQVGIANEDERDSTITPKSLSGEILLPCDIKSGRLYITVEYSRDDIAWHHLMPYELIDIKASIGQKQLEFASVPNKPFEQAGSFSWVTFISENAKFTESRINLNIRQFLPQTVDAKIGAYIISNV